MSQVLLPINYKGYFANEAALTAAVPNGLAGWWAIVQSGSSIYIWNAGTQDWVSTGGGGGGGSVDSVTGNIVNDTDPANPVVTQVQPDWAAVSGLGQILNKPTVGSGDVVGPSSATDNAVARYDTTTGKLIQNSAVLIDDSNNVSTPTSFSTGANGGSSGQINFFGSTSGSATIRVPTVAGTSTLFQLPANNGTPGYLLSTDGSGNTSWIANPSPSNNTIVTASLTGTYTINPANGNLFALTMSASTSIGISAPVASPAWQEIYVQIIGATGSENDVLGWDNSITWLGGIPNVDRAAGAITTIRLIGQGGTWYGSVENSGTQIINDQTGSASYTFTSSDHNAVVIANYASALTYTLPQQSTSSLEPGYTTKLINTGNGTVRIVKTGSDAILTDNIFVATGATMIIDLVAKVAGVNYWAPQGGTAINGGNIEKTFSNDVANSYAYPLLLESESNGTITGITICASSAAVAGTFIVAINGTAVTGLNAVATGTTTPLNYTATANNTYQVGDIITITFSGSTTLVNVTASLKITTYQNVQ